MKEKTSKILKITGLALAALVFAGLIALSIVMTMGRQSFSMTLSNVDKTLTEVYDVYPGVSAQAEGEYKEPTTEERATYALSAVKTLKTTVDENTKEILSLEEQVESLEAKLDEIAEAFGVKSDEYTAAMSKYELAVAKLESVKEYLDALEAWKNAAPLVKVVDKDENVKLYVDAYELAGWLDKMPAPKYVEWTEPAEETPTEDTNVNDTDNSGDVNE